jgi:hypothetical protein
MNTRDLTDTLGTLLGELIDGPGAAACMLNRGDVGLLRSLDTLSARYPSAAVAGGTSVAAHVDHLRYGLALLNRSIRGQKPFVDADYAASWQRGTVSHTEWAARRDALRAEAYAWREALEHSRDVTGDELTAVVASVAHLAYHLGAIRQIDRSIRGPSARD